MKNLLRDLPVFAGLDESALELLLAEVRELQVADGGEIVSEGQSSNEMFFIAAGEARVCKGFGTPGEVELARLGPMDFFGEMCILETLGRSATVQAVGDCTVFGLGAGAFHRLYRAMPGQHGILVINLARDLSRRLRRMDEKFAALQ